MAKRSAARPVRKPSKSDDGRVTPAAWRKAQDQMIQAGAFQKPLNRLVHRDPAKTVTACRGAVCFLAQIEQPLPSDDLKAARADMYQTVVDALETLERDLAGFWADGATDTGPWATTTRALS